MAFPIVPVAAAGLSFLGGVLSSKSNDKTNQTNLQIARENNQWSEQMMQKQMDYNTLMWEKNNQYNSAAAQRARLEQAGLNPYLMMNGGSAGTATAASSPSLPSPTTPTMQPMRYDFSNIANSIADFQRIKIEQQTADSSNRLTDMQSDWYGAKTMVEIGKALAETKNTHLRNFYQDVTNQFAKSMMNQQYIQLMRQNESIDINNRLSILQGVHMMQEINAFPERNRAEISNIAADTALKIANKTLTLRQAKTEFFKQAESSLRATGQRVNNELLKKTFNALVGKAYNDASGNAVGNLFDSALDLGSAFFKYKFKLK